MHINPITILLIIAFAYPVVKGFMIEFSSTSLKSDINDIEGDIGFLISLILGFYFTRKIFVQHDSGVFLRIYDSISKEILVYIENKPMSIYFIILPVVVFIVYCAIKLIFHIINFIFFYPILDGIQESLKHRSTFFKKSIGALFEVPKSVCYILFLAFLLNIISLLNISPVLEGYLEKSRIYNYLCKNIVIPATNSNLAKQLPSILNNSFKIEIVQNTSEESTLEGKSASKTSSQRTIVYYNGVTLEEGIKSNSAIDNFAVKLVEGETSDEGRAKKLYSWIGGNISYDYAKANRVLNNDFNIKSGAIPTFQNKTGICFDYSCLYVSMCRAVGLKVRLITGEGFNGVSWVSHAWNQVYIPSSKTWINVDTTFYSGGNYFNSKRFDFDHKNANIVGEW